MSLLTIVMIGISSALLFAATAIAVLLLTPIWDFLVARQMGQLTDRFNQLSLDADTLFFCLRLWGIGMVAVFLILWIGIGMLPVAIVVTAAIYVSPRHVLNLLIRRRSRLLRDQLVTATVRLGNAVKAGLSMAQGIESIAADTPAPLAHELTRIANDYDRGRPLKEAIEAVRTRLNLEEFTLFALAIEVALDRGGRVNEALDRISSSLAEHQRLERKLESETANGKRVVLILSCFPLAFILLNHLFAPDLCRYLYNTLWGHLVLSMIIGLVYVGYRYASHILNIDLK
jgi:tight adherence protein B